MVELLRARLPPLHTHHVRNPSTNSVESDSSESSPDRDLDEDTEGFLLHANDSQSSIGALTALRDCDMEVDLEHIHRVSPISKLPPELLIAIFSKLTTTSDLRSCMLVCYHWALYTVNILWHRPLCNKWPNLQNVARTLSDIRPTFPYHEMVKRLNLSAIADKVNNGTVLAFMNCKGIERLTLTSCSKLTDSGVEGLVDGSKRLQALDVTDLEHLTDRTLHRVAENCPKLQGLNITNCSNITDDSLVAVAESCLQLKRVTDSSVIAVARNCRSILEIDLAGCHSISSDSVTALLSNLPQLRELRLAHCSDITDRAFTNLSPTLRFDALRVLDLTACEEVRDDAIARIIPAAPRLRNLVLSKCRHITDQAVRAICHLTKNLHYIHLGHCTNLTDAAVIEMVQQCNRIRYIDLACCSRLTDQSVRHLAKLPKLRRIGLVKCQNLTDSSIIALARGPYGSGSSKPGMPTQFVSLERVHLSYCVNLTLKGITQLLLNCPRLTHLSLTGVQAFLRDDLTRFCREAPPEFTHPQRDVFCVFSGEGVARLREYLARLAMEEEQREQQSAIEERLLGPDSPDADSMSDDGTIDGNDQTMDFVYGPGRHGVPRMSNVGHRPRPRSLHELPSYHVDMPFYSEERYGPWTPSAPRSPELRPAPGPAHLNLMSSSNLWFGDIGHEGPRTPADGRGQSRSQSRRHTTESPLGLFPPPRPAPPARGGDSSTHSDTLGDARRQVHGSGMYLSSQRSIGHPSSFPTRSGFGQRYSLPRADANYSAFDVDHEHIMATVPGGRVPSRPPSREASPEVSRVGSRSRISALFGNMRGLSSSSFHAEVASRPGRNHRTRELPQIPQITGDAVARAMANQESAEYSRAEMLQTISGTRHSEMNLLPPDLAEQISTTPLTPSEYPEDAGFPGPLPNTGDGDNDAEDVDMTQ